MASFDILIQIFNMLNNVREKKVMLYVTQLEGVLNAVQQEYPIMLSQSEAQKHYYFYDDTRITYFQIVTAACMAESEEEN